MNSDISKKRSSFDEEAIGAPKSGDYEKKRAVWQRATATGGAVPLE